jgi:hypothetical protein
LTLLTSTASRYAFLCVRSILPAPSQRSLC